MMHLFGIEMEARRATQPLIKRLSDQAFSTMAGGTVALEQSAKGIFESFDSTEKHELVDDIEKKVQEWLMLHKRAVFLAWLDHWGGHRLMDAIPKVARNFIVLLFWVGDEDFRHFQNELVDLTKDLLLFGRDGEDGMTAPLSLQQQGALMWLTRKYEIIDAILEPGPEGKDEVGLRSERLVWHKQRFQNLAQVLLDLLKDRTLWDPAKPGKTLCAYLDSRKDELASDSRSTGQEDGDE